jgi:hypothetical protein
MFDFLKFLVESVTRALPAISRRRRDQRMQEIGAELFLVYVHINEALIRGEDIIGSLETYVKRMRAHLDGEPDPYAMTGGSWIAANVVAQRRSFTMIGAALHRWATELQVLDGESYAALVPLLRGKVSALETLVELLQGGQLPTSTLELRSGAHPWGNFGKAVDIRDEARKAAIPTAVQWDAEIYRRIVRYLDERRPREQLAQIRTLAEEIRASLASHFTVDDLLLEVGDKRFTAAPRYWL